VGPIVAYLSHSYRPEDRAVNMEVWKHLNAKGVVFSVDKPDIERRPMDVTFLERMMRLAHCFIGIVPRRQPSPDMGTASTASHSNWSPYQALELRLALRADKPRLVIFERGMDVGPLPPGEPRVWFDRKTLDLSTNFAHEVDRLVQCALSPERYRGDAPPIGLLRWKPVHPAWSRLAAGVEAALQRNCAILDVDVNTPDDEVLARARDASVVVADLNPRITPAHLIGLLHGAAVPLYRTCLVKSEDDASEWAAALGLDQAAHAPLTAARLTRPRTLQGYRVDPRMRPVHFWTEEDHAGAAQAIASTTSGYREREVKLDQHDSGRRYFLDLSGNTVFISTPGDVKELSLGVKRALDDAGLPAFHFQDQEERMQGGKSWEEQLEEQIAARDLLLAILTPDYFDRVECVDEFETAIRRWERHQMLVVPVQGGDQLPELPPFLSRMQVNAVGRESDQLERLVADLKRVFSKGVGSWTEAAVSDLTLPVDRHVLDIHGHELAGWLRRECGLEQDDADSLAERVKDAGRGGARELVLGLLALVPAGRPCRAAMGRLIYFLRARELEHPSLRDRLSRMFSTLRLFRDLHDVRTWNGRRKEGAPVEVQLNLDHTGLLQLFNRVIGQSPDRGELVRALGAEVGRSLAEGEQASLLMRREARLCVVGGTQDLMVPVEWATFDGMEEPLARARVVVRRVVGIVPERARLDSAFHANLSGPPRVLLFGAPSPDLPHTSQEINALARCFANRYDRSGWPSELVQSLVEAAATGAELEMALNGSDHEVLHLACHAGFDGDNPVVELRQDASGHREVVSAEELGQWLRRSTVRFVYLSCCEGAAVRRPGADLAWSQSLCKALLEAGVPEVLAYVWRVSDEGSVWFTQLFYDRFVNDFDAARALHHARRRAPRSDPFWAASILVQQPDPKAP
jgi:hypothetical protein